MQIQYTGQTFCIANASSMKATQTPAPTSFLWPIPNNVRNKLSEVAKRPWLSYAILLGWTVLANFLALVGLRNIEFTGASQSLPHLRKTPIIHSSKDYSHSKFQSSCSSGSYNSEDFSGYSVPQKLYSGYNHMNEGIKEFYIDVEMNGKGIPVEPVTFVFEGLTFSRCVPPSFVLAILPYFIRFSGT